MNKCLHAYNLVQDATYKNIDNLVPIIEEAAKRWGLFLFFILLVGFYIPFLKGKKGTF